MGLLQDINEVFGVGDLYEVFGVEKTSSVDKIKKAYRKKSLLCHPDKAPSEQKAEFTKKFQTLCKSFDILQDEEKRKVMSLFVFYPDHIRSTCTRRSQSFRPNVICICVCVENL